MLAYNKPGLLDWHQPGGDRHRHAGDGHLFMAIQSISSRKGPACRSEIMNPSMRMRAGSGGPTSGRRRPKAFATNPANPSSRIVSFQSDTRAGVKLNVSPENVREVRGRLEQHHIPYELLVFENEGHGIGKPVNQEKLYPAIADFFERAISSVSQKC